jgi:hypothetical protein
VVSRGQRLGRNLEVIAEAGKMAAKASAMSWGQSSQLARALPGDTRTQGLATGTEG